MQIARGGGLTMRIKDWFKKKKPSQEGHQRREGSEPQPLEEFSSAWNALEQERFEDVLAETEPFLNFKNDVLRLEANKLAGLAYFRSQRYEQATPHFQTVARSSTDVADWFNVVTSATLAGDFQTGADAFDKALECQKEANYSQQPSVPFMRYYYACALRDKGQWETALQQINELRKTYAQLHITDDTFVYIRGVPFLGQTLRVAMDVFQGLGRNADAETWFNSFAKNLDEDGRTLVEAYKSTLGEPL
jgi:tetratricopeptide (TPR) repeat protein